MVRPICYRQGDLDRAKILFGKKKGEPGYESYYDLNGDGEINILDISAIVKKLCVAPDCYTMEDLERTKGLSGRTRGHWSWNSFYDVNDDGIINILDISYMASRMCPTPPEPPLEPPPEPPPEVIELPYLAVENSDICLMPLKIPAGAFAKINIGITTINVPLFDIELIPKVCISGEWLFNGVFGFLDKSAKLYHDAVTPAGE